MRKLSLLAAAMVLVLLLNAQTQKSDWMIGGNFRVNTSKNNSQIVFTPNAGYFFIDNLAVGGNFSLSHTKSADDKYTSFGVGPFARYFFTTTTQQVRPIIHSSFNYLSTKNKIANNYSSTNTGINYFIGGGAAIFISDNVSLDAVLGYDRTKYSGFDGSGGIAFNMGFQVYINKNQLKKFGTK